MSESLGRAGLVQEVLPVRDSCWCLNDLLAVIFGVAIET